MYTVFACVLEEHNLWLVFVAALVSVGACVGAFFVFGGALKSAGAERSKWLFLAATLAGGGTWATHFIAMLGYAPSLEMGFDLSITLLSAGISIAFTWTAFEIYERWRAAGGRVVAGIVLGCAIAAMHYIGMAGFDAPAQKLWDMELVIASGLFSVVFAVAALHAFAVAPARLRLLAASALLVSAIMSLHFTGMGALTLLPDPTIAPTANHIDREMLSAVIAMGAAAILLVGVVLALADRQVAATKLAAAEQAASMALHDALTGLSNRRHLQAVFEQAAGLALSRRAAGDRCRRSRSLQVGQRSLRPCRGR